MATGHRSLGLSTMEEKKSERGGLDLALLEEARQAKG